jgi:sugar phosphate isomerase/epimerase
MIFPGLVSISFRPLSPQDIVALAKRGGLRGIEWGGDVHVPHGDVAQAEAVRRMTLDEGLEVSAYGSYYRAGETGGDNPDFDAVLASAKALGAPVIRVWCGRRGSADADAAYRDTVIADLERIGEKAQAEGITVGCEFHGGTLTDTNESAIALYEALQCDSVLPYWQPPVGAPQEYRLAGLRALLPKLCNLHVFYWVTVDGKRERCPLAEGREDWMPFLELAASTGRDHWAMLEFVRDDSPDQMVADARTLRDWIAEL